MTAPIKPCPVENDLRHFGGLADSCATCPNRRAVGLEALAHKKAANRIGEIIATGEYDKLKVARISEVLKKMEIEIDALVRGKGQHENDK